MTEPNDDPHIVAVGNPMDGFAFYGPFEGIGTAERFAVHYFAEDWWIAPLTSERDYQLEEEAFAAARSKSDDGDTVSRTDNADREDRDQAGG